MPASRKRIPFHPAGPFLARKNFSIFAEKLTIGMAVEAAVFGALHPRRVEQLYSSNHIDMLPPDYDGRVLTHDEVLAADPLDRDGDGNRGGSLTEAERVALAQAGHDLGEWLKLPEPERVAALAAALVAAPSEPVVTGATGGAGPEGGTGATETGQGAAQAGSGAPNPGASPNAVVAAYKAFGFGRYAAVDAEGNKIGDYVMTKGVAAGLAAQAKVPLLGQNGQPISQ
jgi:hypothetical protein